jgi:hypothetical protein
MSWVEWTGILAAATILLVLPTATGDLVEYEGDIGSHPVLSPWMHADAVTTKIAVEEYSSGRSPDRSFPVHRTMALGATLLYYVIGPGLLILYGVGSSSDEETSHVPFQAGLAVVLAGLINLGMTAVLPRMARQDAERENANQKLQDQMTREAFAIGRAAYQYYTLPDSLGGGEGRFRGITFDDIDSTLNFSTTAYELRVESDTLLKIVGTRPLPYPSGEKDSLQVVAQSMPSSVVEIEFQNE